MGIRRNEHGRELMQHKERAKEAENSPDIPRAYRCFEYKVMMSVIE